FEGVWVPRLTPSRVPLLDQRWTVLPPSAANVRVVDAGSRIPDGSQFGARWSHIGTGFEFALSYFDGFNHLPNIRVTTPAPFALERSADFTPTVELTRVYPELRAAGAEGAVPTPWFAIKGEAEYFTTPRTKVTDVPGDDYVLYVVQLERQSGEWVFVGGYVGEVVTVRRAALAFAPDRGLTKSIVGRASYTIDTRRSVAFESAVHQSGDGLYAKAEYSEIRGQHWRVTVGAMAIAGHSDSFLGQYHRNSHIS